MYKDSLAKFIHFIYIIRELNTRDVICGRATEHCAPPFLIFWKICMRMHYGCVVERLTGDLRDLITKATKFVEKHEKIARNSDRVGMTHKCPTKIFLAPS